MVLTPCVYAIEAPDAVVVVSGTRIERDSFDLPMSIDVIDMATAGESQWRVNASEVLSRVPGLVAQNRQNYAQDLQISSRGFGARAAFGVRGVRLLVDGIPATLPDGQGQAATFNLDVAERIEVLRGPFSAIYGNHAGGVVQLFTRDGSAKPTIEARLGGGSDGARKVNVSAQGRASDVNYVVDASRFQTDGYRSHSAALREQAFAKLSTFIEGGKLTLHASAMRQPGAQDPLGVTWSTFERDPQAGEVDSTDTASPKRTFAERYNTRKDIVHHQLGLAWDKRWGDGRLHVVAYGGKRQVLQYQAFSRAFQAPATHAGGVVDFDRDFDGIDMNWTHNASLAGAKVNVTAGLDYAHAADARRGYENFSGSQFGVKGLLRRDEQNTQRGLDPYLQAEWQAGPWQASAGLRHTRLDIAVDDRFLSNGNDSGKVAFAHTTQVIGLLYKVDRALNLYASAASGVEAPTVNEMFYSSKGGFNFGLAAARSSHVEAGLKGQAGSTRFNAAVFQIKTRNELVVDVASGGRTSYRNASRTLRQGAELALDAALGTDWQAHTAVSMLRAVTTQAYGAVAAGRRLPGVANANLFAELAWAPPASALRGVLEVQASGRIYADDANADRPAPGYALLNAAASHRYAFGKWQLKTNLRLNNLANRRTIGSVIVGDTNKRYYEAAPGRHVMFNASAQFQF